MTTKLTLQSIAIDCQEAVELSMRQVLSGEKSG